MRPKSKTLSATGSTAWLPVDSARAQFNIGIQIDVSAGANLTWSVETTSDDIFDPSVTPVATAALSPLDTGTGDEIGSITVPCRAIRLTATITSGTVKMTMVQGRS